MMDSHGSRRREILVQAFGLGALGIAPSAFAANDDYPNRSISLVIGFAPGGGNDVMGRLVADQLRAEVGQPVVAENKAGADGSIAAQYVANAKADGYTLLSGSSGMMAYNPGLNKNLRYDPLKDFVPITMIGSSLLMFSVHPAVPAKSLREFVALAKAKPHSLFYASPSSPHQVAFEAFKIQTGIDVQHIPYKGSGPALIAATAGDVQLLVSSVSDGLQLVRAGKLRPLAVTGRSRSQFLPDVPTVIESGVEFENTSWIGLYAPANTPTPVVDRLYTAMAKILKSESFQKASATVGYELPPVMPPAEFTRFTEQEMTHWTGVIRELHLSND